MALIKALQKTNFNGEYILITDIGVFTLKGDPTSIAFQIQNIGGFVANFLLKEDDSFLLQENDDKIIL
jgi:hypothetical protein